MHPARIGGCPFSQMAICGVRDPDDEWGKTPFALALRHTDPALQGAYGYRLSGIADLDWLVKDGVQDWPELTLSYEQGDATLEPARLEAERAEISMAVVNAKFLLDRAARTLTVRGPSEPTADEIVHPCLWPSAAVFARWDGRETFHAGGFLDSNGGAWGVLGNSGDGKSTMLAALACAGRPVVDDDLLVTDSGRCFAGPRCIDLLPESAHALGIFDDTVAVRSTSRRRMTLPPVPAEVPLRGWVHLDWGQEITVTQLGAAELIERLARHRRVLGLEVDPIDLLDLGVRPTLLLRRPHDWDALTDVREALLSAVAAL
jgi:hypothetical protein